MFTLIVGHGAGSPGRGRVTGQVRRRRAKSIGSPIPPAVAVGFDQDIEAGAIQGGWRVCPVCAAPVELAPEPGPSLRLDTSCVLPQTRLRTKAAWVKNHFQHSCKTPVNGIVFADGCYQYDRATTGVN
jgi:hypothetical protein